LAALAAAMMAIAAAGAALSAYLIGTMTNEAMLSSKTVVCRSS
jgi:hypothetical protein